MDKKRIVLFLSFMFGVFAANAIVINKDSLKSKYELNDPRNPDCPCHKHQQLAEEEYRNLLKSYAQESGRATSVSAKKNEISFRKSNVSIMHSKRKRRGKSHPVLKKLLDVKRYKILRKVTDTNACFKWKK